VNKKVKLNLTIEAEQDLSNRNKDHQLNLTKAGELEQRRAAEQNQTQLSKK
jgi:hypothetical protein